jgi:hypothetical protein
VRPHAAVVVFGDDVGFRIEGQRGRTPVGKIVVRIDDQWVEAAVSQTPRPVLACRLANNQTFLPEYQAGAGRESQCSSVQLGWIVAVVRDAGRTGLRDGIPLSRALRTISLGHITTF